MNKLTFDPINILDVFCREHSEAVTKIEQVRLMKGKELPDWPYWCFLPITCWTVLFMDKRNKTFTKEIWSDIQKLSVLGSWRYSKGIYTPHSALLQALIETPISDSLPVDVFLHLPEWCIYVRTPGMFFYDQPLYGFWATINKEIADNSKCLFLLLNRQDGVKTEILPIKSGSVNSIIENMFHTSLDGNGAELQDIEAVKKSDYLSDYLKKKAENLSKLLSVLLYICSDEPEIDSERQPGTSPIRPKPVKTKKGFRLFPASGPRYWTVGDKTGQRLGETALNDEMEIINGTGRHVRAHVRRGHWHGFWSGKRDEPEQRKFSYHWLPPQVIGGRRQ